MDRDVVGCVGPPGPIHGPHVGHVFVRGPDGHIDKMCVSTADSTSSIEQLLRTLFLIPKGSVFVLRDNAGFAVPLSGGLLQAATRLSQPENGETMPCGTMYQLQLIGEDPSIIGTGKLVPTAQRQNIEAMRSGKANYNAGSGEPPSESGTINALGTRFSNEASPCSTNLEARINFGLSRPSYSVVEDECNFWCRIVGGFRTSTYSQTATITNGLQGGGDFHVLEHSDQLWSLTSFDTSPTRIGNLYNGWAARNKKHENILAVENLRHSLRSDFGISLKPEQLQEALCRVAGQCWHLKGPRSFSTDECVVSRTVFTSLWQRLMLGAMCRQTDGLPSSELRQSQVRLTAYNVQTFEENVMTDQEFLFGGILRQKSEGQFPQSCWARIDSASPERVTRLGGKFFLHPILTEEAIDAVKEGTTKVDTYKHQYFVTLEVYGIYDNSRAMLSKADSQLSPRSQTRQTEMHVQPAKVCDIVARSTMCLVATGNPSRGYRDWLMSAVNTEQVERIDPLDRFKSGTQAALGVLDRVRKNLKAHGQMREYRADFLLFSILDQAARQAIPICHAYGRRLRWLQDRLDEEKLRIPACYINEVSNVCLELQELRQWIGQMRAIIKQLEVDCRAPPPPPGETAWNFGACEEHSGQSLMIFLHSTQESLEGVQDRLTMLNELAQNFAHRHERHNEAFMNRTLALLTTASAVFMPAQFFCGVYGMNFVDENGDPSLPELRWTYGYVYFWMLVICLITAGACIVRFFLRP